MYILYVYHLASLKRTKQLPKQPRPVSGVFALSASSSHDFQLLGLLRRSAKAAVEQVGRFPPATRVAKHRHQKAITWLCLRSWCFSFFNIKAF